MSTIWITGASSGIGRALGLRLAGDGHHVAASARGADALAALGNETRAFKGAIHPYPLDVTDREATAAAIAAIERDLGPIDIAVLAAGTHKPVSAEAFEADGLARLVAINLIGVGNCLEPLLQRMIARRRGRIALVSSVAGYRGLPTSAYYGATKAALINLAESLKFDLDRHGVTMQLIDPGFVRTPLTDKNEFAMPFLIEPEAAAERIARGLESSRFEITFPRRFTYLLKLLRCLPYRLYFPLVARATRK
ncbi:MAG TPA: SDR family NAD(P)-dependent oxidoreductase [Geminicoccaceae bacterium]|nr:SDR family NAD(P)-dependent oxidoreductase [Geminicoccaceae bacterium]